MKVLWFSPTPSLFNPKSNTHNGGGWVASLEKIVHKDKNIQLAVAFEFGGDSNKYCKDTAVYYTIDNKKGRIQTSESFEVSKLKRCLEIIRDYKPDIIQIFGSENYFGKICQHTNKPVVIHIQGSMPPYRNALFPQAMSKYDFLFTKGLSLRYRFMGWNSDKSFHRNELLEINTFRSCNYFMGRTDWDHNLVKIYHPEAKYYHVEEALRDSFLNGNTTWHYDANRCHHVIVSVISNPWYKGFDLILKTAKLLKEILQLDFEWQVYGFRNPKFFEHKYGIKSEDVNVRVMGTASKEQLVEALCNASCYVHSSYIDNSPNSLCEAQILGVPVLATHVGGISSLIENGSTGILFPANDPFTLAVHIQNIVASETISVSLSEAGKKAALARHNPDEILRTLLSAYKDIIDTNKQ